MENRPSVEQAKSKTSLWNRVRNRFLGGQNKPEPTQFLMSAAPQWLGKESQEKVNAAKTSQLLDEIEAENQKREGFFSRLKRNSNNRARESWQKVAQASNEAGQHYANYQSHVNEDLPTGDDEKQLAGAIAKTALHEVRTAAYKTGEGIFTALSELSRDVNRDLHPPTTEKPKVLNPELTRTQDEREFHRQLRHYNHLRTEIVSNKEALDELRYKLASGRFDRHMLITQIQRIDFELLVMKSEYLQLRESLKQLNEKIHPKSAEAPPGQPPAPTTLPEEIPERPAA